MEQHFKTRSMVETALLSAITVIFSFVGLYVPFLGIMIMLIWPIPIAILVTRHGLSWGLMATSVSGLLVMMFSGPVAAITIVGSFGLIGIALGYALKRDEAPGKVLFAATAASFISKVLVVALTMAVIGMNPIQEQLQIMEQTLRSSIDFYRLMGIKATDLAMAEKTFEALLEQMRLIVPATFMMGALFDGALNYVVAKAILQKLGHQLKAIAPFSSWQFSRGTAGSLAAALLIAYMGQTTGAKSWEIISVNVQIIFFVMFAIQGLAVALSYMKRFYRSRIVQSLLVIFVLLNPLFVQLLSFLGIIDSFVDFRKLRVRE